MRNIARIKISANGVFVHTGQKFVLCTPEECRKVLENITNSYPEKRGDKDNG